MIPKESHACGILFCYNEEAILPFTLKHYLDMGIDIVIIDNCSTDSSMNIVKNFQNISDHQPGKILDVLSIKTEGYEWKKILKFACEYMHKNLINYEWILLIDADAFYYSPVRNMTLLQFMRVVKKHGYNVIAGKVYNFYPTEKDDQIILSPIEKLKYYEFYMVTQHRIFLYDPTVDFYTEYGHEVRRDGIRVWGRIKFIYKHYPWLSYEHGLKKIFGERIPRYVERKEDPRRHVHYLSLLPIKKDLVRSSDGLRLYDERKVFVTRFYFSWIIWYAAHIRWRVMRLAIHRPASVPPPELESAYLLTPPAEYHFLMTNYCNAACLFCNQPTTVGHKNEITMDKFKIMLSHIPLESAKTFYFSGGGEPLLCRDLFEMIRYVNEICPWVNVHIRTNGLLIGKYARELSQLNIHRLEISVHGMAEINDIVLQRKCSQDIFDGIAVLNSYLAAANKKMEKAFYPCVWKFNINEVPELIKKASELKVDEVSAFFARIYPVTGYRKQSGLTLKDSLLLNKTLYNHVISKSKRLARTLNIRFNYEPLFSQNFNELPCCQPWQLLVTDPDGYVYPCCGGEDWFYEKVRSGAYDFGNLLKEGVKDFWNNETYILLRRTCSFHFKDTFNCCHLKYAS